MLRNVLLVTLFSYSTFCVTRFPFIGGLSFDPLVINVLLKVMCTGDLHGRLPRA